MAHRSLRKFASRLFTTLSVLSLLLCLATVTCWVRSYWYGDVINRTSAQDGLQLDEHILMSIRGTVCLQRQENLLKSGAVLFPDVTWTRDAIRSPGGTGLPSFGAASKLFGPESKISTVYFPHWFLAALFVLLPVFRAISFIRHRKLRLPGHCRACGYDLRATPDRCPECGTAR